MKKTGRWMKRFLAISLLVCVLSGISARAADISPMYLETNNCTVNLSISNNSATCFVYVKGKDGTSSISGKIKLYDVTAGKSVKTWSIYQASSSYQGSKTAAVKSGHKYKLTFTGKVYDSKGKSESLSMDSEQTKLTVTFLKH